MITPLQALMQQGSPPATPFTPVSRYYGLPTAQLDLAQDNTIIYLTRRFVPPPGSYAPIGTHIFQQDIDRLDRIAAKYLGNAELFWQLCDANGAMKPAELEQSQLRLTIEAPGVFLGTTNG